MAPPERGRDRIEFVRGPDQAPSHLHANCDDEAGEDSEAAVAAADAECSALEATLPWLLARQRTIALSLGILLGGLPESELDLAMQNADFVALAPIPVGERADILRRRPDVRAAERMLAAATDDLDVATAQLFPKIVFGGNAGFQSLENDNLFDSTSQIATLGLSITWRIFIALATRRSSPLRAGDSPAAAASIVAIRSAEMPCGTIGYCSNRWGLLALNASVWLG